LEQTPHIVGGIDSGNGTVIIPFECDAPKGAKLAFLTDSPDLDENNLKKFRIHNSRKNSKYAYFKT